MKDPYSNLPIGELQSVLPEAELDELEYLLQHVLGQTGRRLPLLSDKRTLAVLYRVLTVDRLSERGFRTAIINAMDDETLRTILPADDGTDERTTASVREHILAEQWRDTPVIQRFVEVLGLPRTVVPRSDTLRLGRFVCPAPASPLRPMLDYQLDVHDRVIERLKYPNVRTVVQMPTGSGKTLTAMNIIASFLGRRQASQVRTQILWFAHAEELCEQALESFVQVWSHIGTTPIEVVRSWASFELPQELPGDAIVIATFQKAHHALSRNRVRWKADLLVVDEAHRAPAPTYLQAIERMQAINGRVLGLTATPGRSSRGRAQNEQLADLFGGEIIGLDFGERGVIQELQARGILSVLRLDPIDVELPIEVPAREWRRLAAGKGADFSPEFLRDLALNRHRNTVILGRMLELLNEGEQILYFAPSVAQSRIIVAALLSAGHSAAHVDADTGPQARLAAISEFRRGRIRLLSNFGVLSTGFDAPQTTCVFIGRPTASVVLYSQMIGRGLRGLRLGGSGVCRLG